jgi:hypothetical protein
MKRMTGRCDGARSAWKWQRLPYGRAATTPRRGHHDYDDRDLLFALYSLLHYAAATDMRTIDPAIARLLLGRCSVDNDLQLLTAEQSQCAALARLRFAVQFPAVAAATSTSTTQK